MTTQISPALEKKLQAIEAASQKLNLEFMWSPNHWAHKQTWLNWSHGAGNAIARSKDAIASIGRICELGYNRINGEVTAKFGDGIGRGESICILPAELSTKEAAGLFLALVGNPPLDYETNKVSLNEFIKLLRTTAE